MELSENILEKHPNLKSSELIIDPNRVINPFVNESD